MREIRAVYMRGGTSKGLIFHRDDLPLDRRKWDSIFLQAMGSPDPKQIDGLGGTVSSNNKIVVVWKSELPEFDLEYLVGQVIVGKHQIDYKSNCGNMTSAVGPFGIEEGLVKVYEPVTTVRMLNQNTNQRINVEVPVENGTFAHEGSCSIAGVDGTAAELRVNFLNPAGSKTGKFLPTGNPLDILEIDGFGKVEATILDVSNPLVLVHAGDIGLTGRELPEELNSNPAALELLEKIRGTACCMMGFARNLKDASENFPAVPKVGYFSAPKSFRDISGQAVSGDGIDMCTRVISVFKLHKACPLTSACAISTARFLPGGIVQKILGKCDIKEQSVSIGHPSGVMTIYPHLERKNGVLNVSGVAVQRTARRIMSGFVYIKN